MKRRVEGGIVSLGIATREEVFILKEGRYFNDFKGDFSDEVSCRRSIIRSDVRGIDSGSPQTSVSFCANSSNPETRIREKKIKGKYTKPRQNSGLSYFRFSVVFQ